MSDVAEAVARLTVVLAAEEDLYLRLRDLLVREEEVLIGLDPAEMDGMLQEKQSLAEEGRLLEESRALQMKSLARGLGLPETGVRLSELIDALGDEAGELPAVHARLSALVDSTRALLEGNDRFASRSLTRVREILRMLGRAVPEPLGYGPGARGTSSTGRGRLVRQAI